LIVILATVIVALIIICHLAIQDELLLTSHRAVVWMIHSCDHKLDVSGRSFVLLLPSLGKILHCDRTFGIVDIETISLIALSRASRICTQEIGDALCLLTLAVSWVIE
jgi:hypothetical protein